MSEDKTISKRDSYDDMTALEKKNIKESVSRTDTEKFFLFTRLMKIHFMLKNAKIIKK